LTHTQVDMSEIFVELLIIGVVVLVTVGVHAVVQRRLRSDVLRAHNDVAGFLFSAVGVIYAVVLGFIVVVVWEKYDATVANVENEVASVSDLYRTSSGLGEPVRTQVRNELKTYTEDIIHVEWPLMSSRVIVPKDQATLETMAHQINAYAPSTTGQSNAQQMSMTQLERLFDARRNRLVESAPSVPLVLWFALVSGALAMLAFAFLFGVENRPAQLVMTAILAGLIAILFIVISEFDEPFNGSVSISAEGWQVLQAHLSEIQ
jgi:hypothetical protein